MNHGPWLGVTFCSTNESPPFAESAFFRELSIHGQHQGVHVFIFCPKEISANTKTVLGYVYNVISRKWDRKRMPLPDLIYDRCFYVGPAHFSSYQPYIQRLKQWNIPFLGYGLKGKWEVYEILRKSDRFKPYLPDSSIIYSASKVLQELDEEKDIVLKPKAGAQGKGIYRLTARDGWVEVTGRDEKNRMVRTDVPLELLKPWLSKKISPGRSLVQPYLHLTTRDGRSFDIRSLVQKNGNGQWVLTGMAARCGQKDSLTSNLHGGGDVYPVKPFLQSEFGDPAEDLMEQIQQLSIICCKKLEEEHGRLAEVGVDFGIDRDQNIWILEANSKPGRSVFTKIQDAVSRRYSVENIILYAKTLL